MLPSRARSRSENACGEVTLYRPVLSSLLASSAVRGSRAVMQHGAESYFVVGEGLLGESGGGRDRPRRGGRARRRRRSASRAWGRRAPATSSASEPQEARPCDGGRRRRRRRRSRGLHLPRPVPRPRPDLRQDRRHARRPRSRRRSCCRRRSPSLDLDSLYGAGPQDPESAKFYEADGIHLKVGTTDGRRRHPGQGRLRPAARRRHERGRKRKAIIPDPRNDENLAVAQTHAGDDPLPQPRRRQPARRRVPAGPALRPGARARHQALPVDGPHGLPAADLRAQRWSTTSSLTAARCSRSAPTPTDVPTMPIEFSVAALPARALDGPRRLQLEQDLRRRRRHARLPVHLLRRRAATSAARRGCRATGSPTSAASTTSARPGAPNLTVPAAKFNRAMRIDTHLVDPLANLPAETFGGSGDPARRPAPQPRLPQPDAGAHGPARHRPADGRRS